MTGMALGRLALGPPSGAVSETIGDPVTGSGGAVVPAARVPIALSMQINTILSGASTLAQAQALRRQLRAMLANTPLKLQGFLYFVYDDDSELNSWVIPDPVTLQSRDATAFKAGLWETTGSNWWIVGHQRTHREARRIWMKDLRTGLYARDYRGWILSTDFAALPALQLSSLPNGASSAIQTVSGAVISGPAMPTGRDGGACQVIQGLTDLLVVSYERSESALNLSDVIAYDRMGQITAPSTGPDTSWLEVYGPDWSWSWQTGQPHDAPVLDNGLVRVRYDATHTPGFRVDVWNGTAYVEQGKMAVVRNGAVAGACDTWVSASLRDYTPDRAVALVVLAESADAASRESVYITVERGEMACAFEVYPALEASGAQAGVSLAWTAALNGGAPDLNQTAVKIDSQGTGNWAPGAAGAATAIASAGTGAGSGNSGPLTGGGNIGASSFASSENWFALLRYPTGFATIGSYQANFAVRQATAAATYFGGSSVAYGVSSAAFLVTSAANAGYLYTRVAFAPTQPQQVMEAESMTLGSGTAVASDAAASGTGNNTTTATRTTDANAHVTQANWPGGFFGTYRVFARVKVSSGTGSFYMRITAGPVGATVTTTSTSYVWLDLGEINAVNNTLEIHAWLSAAGTVYVDRIEAALVTDRVRAGALFSGGRDQAQAALYDSRTIGALVARG